MRGARIRSGTWTSMRGGGIAGASLSSAAPRSVFSSTATAPALTDEELEEQALLNALERSGLSSRSVTDALHGIAVGSSAARGGHESARDRVAALGPRDEVLPNLLARATRLRRQGAEVASLLAAARSTMLDPDRDDSDARTAFDEAPARIAAAAIATTLRETLADIASLSARQPEANFSSIHSSSGPRSRVATTASARTAGGSSAQARVGVKLFASVLSNAGEGAGLEANAQRSSSDPPAVPLLPRRGARASSSPPLRTSPSSRLSPNSSRSRGVGGGGGGGGGKPFRLHDGGTRGSFSGGGGPPRGYASVSARSVSSPRQGGTGSSLQRSAAGLPAPSRSQSSPRLHAIGDTSRRAESLLSPFSAMDGMAPRSSSRRVQPPDPAPSTPTLVAPNFGYASPAPQLFSPSAPSDHSKGRGRVRFVAMDSPGSDDADDHGGTRGAPIQVR